MDTLGQIKRAFLDKVDKPQDQCSMNSMNPENAVVAIFRKWNLAMLSSGIDGRVKKWALRGVSGKHLKRILGDGDVPGPVAVNGICEWVWDELKNRNDATLRSKIYRSVVIVIPKSPTDWESERDLRDFLIEHINATHEAENDKKSEAIKHIDVNCDGPRTDESDFFVPGYFQLTPPSASAGLIKSFVVSDQIPPHHTFYLSSEASTNWIEMCDDVSYRVYYDSASYIEHNKSSIVSALLLGLDNDQMNYISLGPGNGHKDKSILSAIIKATSESMRVNYYAYDVSRVILSKCVETLYRESSIRNAVNTTKIAGEFRCLPYAVKYFRKGCPNLYLLLGNTLGNMPNDGDFLKQMHRVLNVTDRFVLEVRIKSDKNTQGGSTQSRDKFSFYPLKHLGVDYEPGKLNWPAESQCSQISETKTLVGTYGPYDATWHPKKKDIYTRLAYIHNYEMKKFREFLSPLFDVVKEFDTTSDEIPSTVILVLKKKFD